MRRISLKAGLLATIVICWLAPIVTVVVLAGILLGNSYSQSVRQEMETAAENAMERVQTRLQDAMNDSKMVSYDGTVRSSYRSYMQESVGVVLYRSVSDYLTHRFSLDEKYKAVFINFWDKEIAQPYALCSNTAGYEVTLTFRDQTASILEAMQEADTDILFLLLDGELYMARNLLDSSFTSYATERSRRRPGDHRRLPVPAGWPGALRGAAGGGPGQPADLFRLHRRPQSIRDGGNGGIPPVAG